MLRAWWATLAVFVGYIKASVVVTVIAARTRASGAVATGRLSGSFFTAQAVGLLFGSLVPAGVVYLLVNAGGEGPTFARVLLALVLGNVLGAEGEGMVAGDLVNSRLRAAPGGACAGSSHGAAGAIFARAEGVPLYAEKQNAS